MGKNTDKLYVTQSEHSGADGRHGASTGITHKKIDAPYRRLPYIFCALTLQPWEHPVCAIDEAKNATIFDLLAIVPWLQKKGTNPISGKPLEAKDLLKLNFVKNDQDEYCDPVTMKVFNDHTHIVAIRSSGNVFAFETIQTLNYKPKNWVDLVSDEPFTRADVIQIQDPHNLGDNHDISKFAHLKERNADATVLKEASKQVLPTDEKDAKVKAAKDAIERLREKGTSKTVSKTEGAVKKVLPYNAANYSTGYTAASFTSTGMTPSTKDDRAMLTEAEYLLKPKKVKIKGLGVIVTNHGPLDIELFPEHAPKAVYNFVKLAKSGYYNGLTFHRNIPGYMIQGGDPTGRGNGGKSFFGKDFEDEFSATQSHDRRGIISMANKGFDTNSSQFFITYEATKHLDKKHTIFGHVIGNIETLDKLERLDRDGDRPVDPIIMSEVQILIDPFEEHLKKEEFKRSKLTEKRAITDDDLHTWTNQPVNTGNRADVVKSTAVIGKYLETGSKQEPSPSAAAPPQKKVKTKGFGDFSGW